MKKIILFGKGMCRAVMDSWASILLLFFTCIIGVVGVGFCYRTAVFQIRQPESIDYFGAKECYVYIYKGNNLSIDMAKIQEYAIVNITGETQAKYKSNIFNCSVLSSSTEDKLDFADKAHNIVVNAELGIAIGDKVSIEGIEYNVIATTEGNSYISVQSIDKYSGVLRLFREEQFTRAEMSATEKAIGAKLQRDWNTNYKLTSMNYMFIALAILILLIISINTYRLFALYVRNNERRYKLYRRLGMTKRKNTIYILLEGVLILAGSLIVALLIDGLWMRPISTIIGIEYLYDIIDIVVISLCVLIPFVLVMTLQAFHANKLSRKLRGTKNV